MVGNFYI